MRTAKEQHSSAAIAAAPAMVPPEYKRTAVGVIPNDWEVALVEETFAFLPTTSHSRAQLTESGTVAYVHYGDIHTRFNHFIDFRLFRLPHVSDPSTAPAGGMLRDGDLILADASEDEEGVGKGVEIRGLGQREAIAGLHTLALRATDDRTVGGYRAYLFEKPMVKSQLRRIATGLKVFGISKAALRGVGLPLPPPPEQRAIAEALSDVDRLLGALEALIAKKRAIKKATMQKLLTGKTRLPGFSGPWEKKRLGEIGATYGGLVGKSKADFGIGDTRYVTFLNVLENVILDPRQFERVRVAIGESQNAVRRGDLLFNGTSETPGDLAMGSVAAIDQEDLYLNSFCFGFRLFEPRVHSPLFLAYYFRGIPGRRIMYALAQGATRYNMSKGQFMALGLRLPPADEQTAIATVLSDMDAEIAALERRRDKTRAIKQGMMQQLLTGRVRLVEAPEREPSC